MIELNIKVDVDDNTCSDIELALTAAIHMLCGSELQTLGTRLCNEWKLSKQYGRIVHPEHTRMAPEVIYRLSFVKDCLVESEEEQYSVSGQLLMGAPVYLKIHGCSADVFRNNVLCNTLSLLFPLLPYYILVDLISAWSLTGASALFQRALCEYYLTLSRFPSMTGSLHKGLANTKVLEY